jgi:hypothetical protein
VQEKPCSEYVVVYSTGVPLDEDYPMQFRLLYSGNQLVSNGDASAKHVLRKAFHPQLKQLWETNFQLKQLAQQVAFSRIDPRKYLVKATVSPEDRDLDLRNDFFASMGALYNRGNFNFVPLVVEDLCLRVSIDILFLRPDQHPLIKAGGDLDNRLKTLFDALRVPETTDGLGGNPEKGEDPFFVLLYDDCLISEIRVNTDNLLMLPARKALDAKDVFLVMDIKINPMRPTRFSWAFE